MFYAIVKCIGTFLFKIFLRLEVEGQENIPKDGAFVLCCNHISLLDPPVVGAACTRKIHWMAKEELFVPVLGTIYKWLGAFPVKRGTADRTAITHGINILKNKEVLAIFPEGTRSKTGALGKAAPGALMMAGRVKATILPTCVIGTDVKRQGKLWPKVKVKFGKPIPFPKDEVVGKDLLNRLSDEMMASIAELQAGELKCK